MIAAASGWNPPWHGVIVLVVGALLTYYAVKAGPHVEAFFYRWTFRAITGRWPDEV